LAGAPAALSISQYFSCLIQLIIYAKSFKSDFCPGNFGRGSRRPFNITILFLLKTNNQNQTHPYYSKTFHNSVYHNIIRLYHQLSIINRWFNRISALFETSFARNPLYIIRIAPQKWCFYLHIYSEFRVDDVQLKTLIRSYLESDSRLGMIKQSMLLIIFHSNQTE
jgi:hypothetical protein